MPLARHQRQGASGSSRSHDCTDLVEDVLEHLLWPVIFGAQKSRISDMPPVAYLAAEYQHVPVQDGGCILSKSSPGCHASIG
jgi:hypothetical protein